MHDAASLAHEQPASDWCIHASHPGSDPSAALAFTYWNERATGDERREEARERER